MIFGSMAPLIGGALLALPVGKGISFSKETGEQMQRGGRGLFWFGGLCLLSAIVLLLSPPGDFSYEQEAPPDGGTVGPVQIDEDGMLIETEVEQSIERGTGSFQHWSFVTVELLDENENYLSGFGGELWHESGTDSDGRWREQDKLFRATLQVPSAGIYYLRLQTEANVEPSMLSPIQVRVTDRLWAGNPVPLHNAAYLALLLGMVLSVAPTVGSHPSILVDRLEEGTQVRYDGRTWIVRNQVDCRYDDWRATEWTLHPTGPGAKRPRYLEREYEKSSDWEKWFISWPVEIEELKSSRSDETEMSFSHLLTTPEAPPRWIWFDYQRFIHSDTDLAHRDGEPFQYHAYEDGKGGFLTIEKEPDGEWEAVVGTSISPSKVTIEEIPGQEGG